MGLRSRIASFLSLTQTDITVALVVAGGALVGWGYSTFFDGRDPNRARHDIAALIQRHDSIQSAHRAAQIRQGVTDSANSSQWESLTDQDIAADSAAKAASKSSSGKKQPPSGPININTASKSELMRLPGVGEKTAEAIIGHRNARKFSVPADIMNVKGIGPKKYEKMLPFLKVK
ncbi:MAG: helix-hairpin-helix domain-containing protein [Armatimonadetes bacterium]|nr:helix-hairpin-helix domain-containing protein [Armatimonadota bacterium]